MKYNFIALRGAIALPNNISVHQVGRETSLEALEKAKILAGSNSYEGLEVVLAFQKRESDEYITSASELKKYAVIAKIISAQKVSGDSKSWTLTFDIKSKVKIKEVLKANEFDVNFTEIEVQKVKETLVPEEKVEHLVDSILDVMKQVVEGTGVSEIINIANKVKYSKGKDFASFIYKISTMSPLTNDQKYSILESNIIAEKGTKLLNIFREVQLSRELDREIEMILKKNLDAQQTEFILRERIKAIRKKLGEDDAQENEFDEKLNSKEGKYQYPDEVKKVIQTERKKIKGMMASSPEANISKTYLDLIQNLPWRKIQLDKLDITNAKKSLSQKHYGLKNVKERVLEYLAVLINKEKQNQNLKNKKDLIVLSNGKEAIDKTLFTNESDNNNILNNMPILTLVGPPGTGKTSIAKSIADAIGRKFVKISLGGVKDESEIRGHRRTYVGALPGKIVQAIKKAGVSNPLILLDEIDKMSSDHRGDPASAMLEVLDPEQNKHFQDHYLELEYDLSKVMFVATANYYDAIPEALIDRVEIIELSSYTMLEKVQIAKEHLIEKVLEQNTLDKKHFNISDDVIEYIIRSYTREAGVRELKRVLDKLARKIIVEILEEKINIDEEYILTKEIAVKLLGLERFTDDENEKEDQIGTVNGLAYTAYGGSTLAIEVTTVPGKGEVKLTGQLKDVMQESAQIAMTYVKHNAEKFDIDFDFENNNIHIHVPEGAVPKDGPSAGVTFTTAIISALGKKPVSPKVGMTGEITLRGKVLAIGGLKEKSLAAYKFGIKTIFIPKENERNLIDIPDEVKKEVKYVPVSEYQEIYDYLFTK